MQSPWHTVATSADQTPVEMRFIDMFMMAIGALIFLSLALVIALPKTAGSLGPRPPTPDRNQDVVAENEDLWDKVKDPERQNQRRNEEIDELRERLATLGREALEDDINHFTKKTYRYLVQSRIDMITIIYINPLLARSELATKDKSEDKYVLMQWCSGVTIPKGCNAGDIEFYVRAEGPLIDFESNNPKPEAVEVNAATPYVKEILAGHQYYRFTCGRYVFGTRTEEAVFWCKQGREVIFDVCWLTRARCVPQTNV